MTTPSNTPLSLRSPRILWLTWGGCGLLRPASGTWGTLGAIPFALLIMSYFGGVGLLVAAALIYAISYFVVARHEKISGIHDPSYIVIDEVIGIFIALAPAALNMIDVTAAFFLFRAFDAIKPGIIGKLDKTMPGAHGVLLDDVLAGGLAAVCVGLIHVIA